MKSLQYCSAICLGSYSTLLSNLDNDGKVSFEVFLFRTYRATFNPHVLSTALVFHILQWKWLCDEVDFSWSISLLEVTSFSSKGFRLPTSFWMNCRLVLIEWTDFSTSIILVANDRKTELNRVFIIDSWAFNNSSQGDKLICAMVVFSNDGVILFSLYWAFFNSFPFLPLAS